MLENSTDPGLEETEYKDANELKEYTVYQDYNEPITAKTGTASPVSSEEIEDVKYPNWSKANGSPITIDEIWEAFEHLQTVFGFQNDSVENMFDYFMCLLDSRASRTTCELALLSLHMDYIGGERSNYKKWYFAAHLELDNGISIRNRKYHTRWRDLAKINKLKAKSKVTHYSLNDLDDPNSLTSLEFLWKTQMLLLKTWDYVYQISLYLLIWGEANNVRFMPECVCFIFKYALDYFNGVQAKEASAPEFKFLDTIITPLYEFIREQQYVQIDGKWVKNKKDHAGVIGYDDINQFFWLPRNIERITLKNGEKLLKKPREERYKFLSQVDWKKNFKKTYKELRTWLHLITNFSRVWIIHITMFWYYTSFNSPTLYTVNYSQLVDNKPAAQIQWAVVSLGGAIACLIDFFAAFFELWFVPRDWFSLSNIFGRLVLLILLLAANIAPSVYLLVFVDHDVYSISGRAIGIGQFCFSVVTFLYLAITPTAKLFAPILRRNADFIKTELFAFNFAKLTKRRRFYSILMWLCVFSFKFSESYFFLTLSMKDAVKELSIMDMSRCNGDLIIGKIACKNQNMFLLVMLVIADLLLFFLDTYLWYVICNCIFSVALSFNMGISVFSPWRNIFSRLPDRIYTKIISSGESKLESSYLVSQVWNCFVLSMYREHLLSIDQVKRLIYVNVGDNYAAGNYNVPQVIPPTFFVFQDDHNSLQMNDFFAPNQEAERRVLFFAQSLSSNIPEPVSISMLPRFTVLIPHYSEKIILSLLEVIKEDRYSKLSLLEYLQKLHKTEWETFVQDSKMLDLVSSAATEDVVESSDYDRFIQSRIDDLPYYCVGFKTSEPEHVLRTRVWASVRYQTLYRTVSGFMNYGRAINLLYRLENDDLSVRHTYDAEEVEDELQKFTQHKFQLVLAMQRYQDFTVQEKDNVELLCLAFPGVKISYLETEKVDGQTKYYSTVLEGHDTTVKKFRVRLSGNPILGDGKSDNQNHLVIFCRGEYIQVVDANQDNYIEECLKIKLVLTEFEEMDAAGRPDYVAGVFGGAGPARAAPVAILGAREYIFLENIGVLGDIAAGKEQTFGTLFSRTLAELGAKLHYGHPDFMNTVYMTTRGGLLKAQKGLHVNEDIYAGMTAVARGGRIKNCDYYQCGKGRDLGFGTVVNFTTKIGAGMGEQMLSREHFYFGSTLPVDRLLSFYYTHAGFHLNNVFIILLMQTLMAVLVSLGALRHETVMCAAASAGTRSTDLRTPLGCYHLEPVLQWVDRYVLSVCVCFFMSFTPLVVQELMEKGAVRALGRALHHMASLSPLFEVFVCQVYAGLLAESMAFGGARYVATGRGFSTARAPFVELFVRYAAPSVYGGCKIILALIFVSVTMWRPAIIWFWSTATALCLAPFVFNPHQFCAADFFADYKEFVHWLFRGNARWHRQSWVGYAKRRRARYAGYKRQRKNRSPAAGNSGPMTALRPSRIAGVAGQVVLPLVGALCYLVPYLFLTSQVGVGGADAVPLHNLVRIVVLAAVPILANTVVLVALYAVSCVLGPLATAIYRRAPAFIAGFARCISLVVFLIDVELMIVCHNFRAAPAVCGYLVAVSLRQAAGQSFYLWALSRENGDDAANTAWWSGKWFSARLGAGVFTQPPRELAVKVSEMCLFPVDFMVGHALFMVMAPLVLVPYIDTVHTTMLFWLRPSRTIRAGVPSRRNRRARARAVIKYGIVFVLVLVMLVVLIVGPFVAAPLVPFDVDVRAYVPGPALAFVAPRQHNFNDTGENAPAHVPRQPPAASTMRTVM